MLNHYSCWNYVTRPGLLKLDLFYKQISLNLALFGKNKCDFREEKNNVFQ